MVATRSLFPSAKIAYMSTYGIILVLLSNDTRCRISGYMTGNCINSTRYPGSKRCEVFAWCPTEDGTRNPPDPPALAEAENFTVFIKNDIEFPKFGVKRRNIPHACQDALKNCRYDPETDNQCPVFQLKTIVLGSGSPNFSSIALQGGVIQITISWNCNLDHSEDQCLPEYSFRRLDSKEDVLSPGYNLRFSRYYYDKNGNETRTLFKAYGIKFIVALEGKGGKFSFVKTVLGLGSGLAYLSVAGIICGLIVIIMRVKNSSNCCTNCCRNWCQGRQAEDGDRLEEGR